MKASINIRGQLFDLSAPQVMGILNVTPDSFYAPSRISGDEAVKARVRQIRDEGASMIDVGACSTRPGSQPASESEELERLSRSLPLVRREWPEAIVSVDTFRPSVAAEVLERGWADIVNDVRGGSDEMTDVLSRFRAPYVLTQPDFRRMGEALERLRERGVADVILDPGFGFSGGVESDYRLFATLPALVSELRCPVLVGVSRKSMITKPLGITSEEALPGTVCLNTVALLKGASILRVHDVREAVQCVTLCSKLA